jgi:hypothetical protein
MKRVLTVAQALSSSYHYALAWPLGIMLTSFVINLALFAVIGDQIPGVHITYGVSSIYVVQLVVCAQAMTQMFSFAVGLNASRRAFYLGTALIIVAQSFAYGVLLYLAKLVEHATHGWGESLAFFDPAGISHSNNPVQILVYTVPMLLFSYIGVGLGIVTKRWGSNGIFVLSVLTIAITGGVSTLLTWSHHWSTIGNWFVAQSTLGIAVGWALVPLVLLAAGGYGLLRRATP